MNSAMHLFLVFVNVLYFFSVVVTPHVFFNLTNFVLMSFFILNILQKKVPKDLFYFMATLSVVVIHAVLNFSEFHSFKTHIGIALNLYLAAACGLMVKGRITVSSFSRFVAGSVYVVFLLALLAVEILFDPTTDDFLYVHRSYAFVHMAVAFILIFPRKFALWHFLSLGVLALYCYISGTGTGLILSLLLMAAYYMRFASLSRTVLYSLFGLCGLVLLSPFISGFVSGLSIDNTSGLGRLLVNSQSVLEQFRGELAVTSTSGLERYRMFNVGFELVNQNTLLGVGLDNSKYFHSLRQGAGVHLHNTYLEMVVSLGIPIVLGIALYLYRKYRQKRHSVSEEYMYFINLFSGGVLIYMVTNTIYKDIVLIFMISVFVLARNNVVIGKLE